MSSKILLSAIIFVSLPSCSKRVESAEYFASVTGIEICSNSTVKNIESEERKLAGLGVVYEVELRMSPACESDFMRKVRDFQGKIQEKRQAGQLEEDEWITVEKEKDHLRVTYTA